MLGLGADEDDVMFGENLREPRVLGEKSIARMQASAPVISQAENSAGMLR